VNGAPFYWVTHRVRAKAWSAAGLTVSHYTGNNLPGKHIGSAEKTGDPQKKGHHLQLQRNVARSKILFSTELRDFVDVNDDPFLGSPGIYELMSILAENVSTGYIFGLNSAAPFNSSTYPDPTMKKIVKKDRNVDLL